MTRTEDWLRATLAEYEATGCDDVKASLRAELAERFPAADEPLPAYKVFGSHGPCSGACAGEPCHGDAAPVNAYGLCEECQAVLQDAMDEAASAAYGNW